ncbi:MAG: VWA domain-containing protein [Planctomycetales bacterium]|nr:VWA domain-containing protein [Planctomycetales bacterium]NIM08188.1 VWA domain-containing protein [Planctomycetales bacterium]NIN07685.1 VWA domain-containing protein [Planctomycetales bacterium]NIN76802.1 VWA domain-containing protein [Planctomycetales bacterium]NIO34007.1 VWA domain-containing protein [Planctomycetales bacterium]
MLARKTRIVAALIVLFATFTQPLTPAVAKEVAPPRTPNPKIQMAILLDCSGSMSGLIHQARTQLWKTVNEFAKATRADRPVQLEVALYEYGSAHYPAEEGFLKQLVPLTDDLDRVSEALFALSTSGSQEYCGQVIDAATRHLKWSDNPHDLKCIFIAGNEPFTQGPVDFREACRRAIAGDITVNTIHCGTPAAGISGNWQEGAQLADGSFMNIDHNQQVAAIPAPQDKELARLNAELNKTYVAYGTPQARQVAKDRQEAQDRNVAAASPAAASERFAFKAKAQYANTGWDMVDACREEKLKLEDLKEEELPDEMKKMTLAERKAYLAAKQAQRQKIQAEMKRLSDQRDKFLTAERKKLANQQGDTLDQAILHAARHQATRKEFTFGAN